jgi:hypothetical protein
LSLSQVRPRGGGDGREIGADRQRLRAAERVPAVVEKVLMGYPEGVTVVEKVMRDIAANAIAFVPLRASASWG